MIITPYISQMTAGIADGSLNFNTTNYPNIISAFKFTENKAVSGATTFTDSVSGATWANPAATTTSADGTKAVIGASVTTTLVGKIPNIASTENFLMIGVGILNTGAAISYGDISGGSQPWIGVWETAGNINISAGKTGIGNNTDVSSGVAKGTSVRGFAIWGDTSASGTIYGYVTSGSVVSSGAGDITSAQEMVFPASGVVGGINIANATVYELLLMKGFATLPSSQQVVNMVNIMNYYAQLGKKVGALELGQIV